MTMSMDPMLLEDSEPRFPGADKIRERLEKWLSKIVDSAENEAATVELMLFHVGSPAGETAVGPLTHDCDAPVAETVEDILANAASHLQSVRYLTRVSYIVRVEGRIDRINFTLEAPRSTGMNSERHRDHYPDMEGVTGQQMEINLQLVDRVIDLSTANTEDHRETIRELREENRLLKMNEWELRRQIERLMNGDLQRRMMVEEFKGNERRKDQYANAFQQLLPIGASVALGPNAGAIVQQLQAFAASAGLTGGAPGTDGGGGVDTMMRDAAPATGSGPGGEITDLDRIDRFIIILESRADLFKGLLDVLGKEEEAVKLLFELHASSEARRKARGQQVAPDGPAQKGSSNGRSRRG